MERDEWQRAAWKVMVAGTLDARSLVFVDEMGTNTSLSALGMAGPRRERGFSAGWLAIGGRTPLCFRA
jgi:hypothetical protein